jgi:hypothetical protein
MKVHPRLAMELARHSDMRLTMKTYTDAGQLPLREVIESLPGFGGKADSRIDSRTLGASGQAVSPTVTDDAGAAIENHIENIGESHGSTSAVALCHSEQTSRGTGFESPSLRQFFKGIRTVTHK